VSAEEGPERAEATFADVLNGLTMGGARSRRRSPSARGQPQLAPPDPTSPDPVPPAPAMAGELTGELVDDVPGEENASSVRAYAWTGGRTRVSSQLEIETLISATPLAEELFHSARSEHQSVIRLCGQSRSVAEIAALLSLPIGVVRVLLDDMAGLGLVTVHRNRTTGAGEPDLELLGRVLRGLTNLRG
jgi:hypothetical protein